MRKLPWAALSKKAHVHHPPHHLAPAVVTVKPSAQTTKHTPRQATLTKSIRATTPLQQPPLQSRARPVQEQFAAAHSPHKRNTKADDGPKQHSHTSQHAVQVPNTILPHTNPLHQNAGGAKSQSKHGTRLPAPHSK